MSAAATRWTEALLVGALRSRYGSAEWALVTQVRDGAGWDRRTFDAIAIGLWASRGHEVHGFECKVSRADWRRELAQPAKAEPLAAFCHRWWIVAPRGVVDPLTLPVGWGLLEADGANGPIRTVRQADARQPTAPTRGFVAQLAKRLLAERPATAEVEAAEQRGRQAGLAEGLRGSDHRAQRALAELPELRRRVEEFEEASGIRIRNADLDEMRRMAGIVRLVAFATDDRSWAAPVRRMQGIRNMAAKLVEDTDALLGGEA